MLEDDVMAGLKQRASTAKAIERDLSRREAAELIAEIEDRPFTLGALEALAVRGVGPPYRYDLKGHSKYRPADVKKWCEERRQRAEAMPLRLSPHELVRAVAE
jgi:hypothetical protein